MRKLKIVSFVSVFFIAAQLTGGILANSIAIFTDTAHLASDMIGFAMSMIALKITLGPATMKYTFGLHRAEIIGTLMSVIFLLTITLWLVVEATKRVVSPEEIEAETMLITAVAGLFFNLIQMKILHQGEGGYHLGGDDHDHGHEHHGGEAEKSDDKPETRRNINVDAAYLHVLGDMIMSIGVIIAATIIYFVPYARIADPICTYFFSIIVCFTVSKVVSQCVNVLMEGAPKNIPTDKLMEKIKALENVVSVHDFHVWSISMGKNAMSAHVKCDGNPMKVLKEVTLICREANIDNVTIQVYEKDSMGDFTEGIQNEEFEQPTKE